jgi:hypothetical protein
MVSYFAAVFALLMLAPASAQRIEIQSLPAFGKQGWIRGRVTQADLGRVSVVVFSRVKGFSIQPGCKQTTMQPDPFGFFSARITDDTTATHYAALLVPRDFVPLCHTAEARIPDYIEAQAIASDFRIRPQPREKVIHWSGFELLVREWTGGPGNCVYDKRNVRVDREGRLHLAVIRRKSVYTCAEVVLTKSLGGYGTYRLQVTSGLDTLSPALVFGFFTYSSFSSQRANREIDFAEVSKWGVPADAQDAQFVIQPAGAEGNVKRFGLNRAPQPTFETVWRPDSIGFRAFSDSPALEVDWQHAGSMRPLDQTVHLNLWTFKQPAGNSEVILQKMEVLPLP